MTSRRESSRDNSTRISRLDIESLAGVFHPHAIEIQEFSSYALIIDIRPRADFADDHIPGAVPLGGHHWQDSLSDGGTAGRPCNAEVGVRMSKDLEMLLASVELDNAILVYDGCGGIGSKQLARSLRCYGWTVDVLPGGWMNYRRWVQAGLEALPRLISFRVVDTWLESEARRVLNALAAVGEQVLDLASLAGRRINASQELSASPPAQNWFDSQLVSALRGFDPHRVVWVADVGHQVELVRLPGCLVDAIASASSMELACPVSERLACWLEDEPFLAHALGQHQGTIASSSIATAKHAVNCEMSRPDAGDRYRLLVHHDDGFRGHRGGSHVKRSKLPVLTTSSLAPDPLTEAVRAWLPCLDA